MTATTPAIAFERVSKHFRYFASPLQRIREALLPWGRDRHTPLPVLRDVTFTIPRGETVAVLGANGAGKSTILHIAAGLLAPSSGTVTVDGKVFGLLDLAGNFAPELTGRQNVRFFHDVVLDGAGDLQARESAVQAFADIGEYFDRAVHTYSSGMFLRLAFACATCDEHDILLIDEVIAVGDARFPQKCYRHVRELHARGGTILVVTHAVEMVIGLCDRVLLIDHGELVFDGDPARGVDRYYQLFFESPARLPAEIASEAIRFGTGGARITGSFASLDGVTAARTFARGQRVRLVVDVDFNRDVAAPHFGFSCSTKQGFRVYATTTVLLRERPAPAAAGERRRVAIDFELSVAVADLFIDLSVFEMDHGSVTVLDARFDLLHLAVTSSVYCEGVADLAASFAESVRSGAPGYICQ
jgi:lipopolysaccharide transport system ATP-binding protein